MFQPGCLSYYLLISIILPIPISRARRRRLGPFRRLGVVDKPLPERFLPLLKKFAALRVLAQQALQHRQTVIPGLKQAAADPISVDKTRIQVAYGCFAGTLHHGVASRLRRLLAVAIADLERVRRRQIIRSEFS